MKELKISYSLLFLSWQLEEFLSKAQNVQILLDGRRFKERPVAMTNCDIPTEIGRF